MAAKEIQPTRVMTSPDVAVNPRRARGVQVDLIFQRKDGWELGCPMAMVFWAHRTWADQWASVLVRVGDGRQWVKYSIEEWRRLCFGPQVEIEAASTDL